MAALVIVSWLIGVVVLACQAIYIFCTGQTNWFFARPLRSHPLSWGSRRIGYVLIHLIPAVGMTVLLLTALTKRGIEPVLSWVTENFGMFLYSLFFLLIGLLLLVQPEKMLRLTIRDNPELAESKFAVVIKRCIGAGLFGMGFQIIARL